MSAEAGRGRPWVAVVGDRVTGSASQDAIEAAVDHSAAMMQLQVPAVAWVATNDLERHGTRLLKGAGAVWCAPGGPFRSLDGALAAIRWAREHDVAFLGTCAGFQHGVLEFARNVLGFATAAHPEYQPTDDAELCVDQLRCSLVGQTMPIRLVDPMLAEVYGTRTAAERYSCRFGLHPRWRTRLHDAGLLTAGVDQDDGDVRVLRLAHHPFFVLTLFVPQTSSTPAAAHPLIRRFVDEFARLRHTTR